MIRKLGMGFVIVTAWLVVGMATGELSGVERALNPPAGGKVLRFPAERSVGKLYVEAVNGGDSSSSVAVCPSRVCLVGDWDFLGPAHGDVVVPGNRRIKLTIHMRDARPNDLSFLSKLGPSDLHELSIQSRIKRTPASRPALESIFHLTGLQILSLYQTGIDSRQMSLLRSLTSLRALVFGNERSVGSAGLSVLKDLPALEYLDCETNAIDAGLEHVGQLRNLRWLRVRMGRIRGPGLAHLASLPRLERLSLWGSPLTDRHIRYLEGLTGLKSLTLWGNDVPLTDASLASISKLASLEELHLIRLKTNFTDAGVAKLTRMPKLRNLGASPDDASILTGMQQLESVGGIPLTLRNMKALAGLGNLKSLGLALEGPIKGSGGNPVATLGELKSLEKVHINSVRAGAKCFGDEELAHLESLNSLKDLSISVDGLTDRGLASIGKLKQLESIYLTGTGSLSSHGLNHLNGLPKLERLSMIMQANAWLGGDNTPLNLNGLTNLKNIKLISIRLKGSEWAFLAELENLEELWLNYCGVCSEDGLRYIKGLPKLKVVDLQNVNCTKGDCLAVLGGLKKLDSIRMIGHVTDSALRGLPALPSVRLFDVINDVTVNPETIAHLREVLPNVDNVNVQQPSQQGPSMMQSAPQSRGTTISTSQRLSSTRTRRTPGQRTRRRTNR
ncbi:MAG: hypothetical protein ISS79_01465 [Phycisphaerae bacterium]|nr:hypothetical protein [Phycisphaerae bacterium]